MSSLMVTREASYTPKLRIRQLPPPRTYSCFGKAEILKNLYVFDDGIVKGFIQMNGTEIVKLYADPFFQSHGVGKALIEFAVSRFGANHLWALEKNARAIAFYGRHDFLPTGKRKFEEGTTEYLVELRR